MSFRMKLINFALRTTVKPILSLIPFNRLTLGVPRELVRIVGSISPPNKACFIHSVSAHNIPAEVVEYAQNCYPGTTQVMLYLHGGGYIAGSPLTHRNITTRLSYYAECTVLAIDYRKAPEHPYPAALDDAVESYTWLLEQGYKPENIIILGDSAGGNLTLATALAIRDRQLPQCAGIVCISPWTDLTASGETHTTKKSNDPMIPSHRVIEAALLYANGIPLDDPRVSPLYADYENMPPMLIHVGDKEVLLSDSQNLHKRAIMHGVKSHIKIWKNAPHVFQLFAGLAPQSSQSLKEIALFAKCCWKGGYGL